MKNQRNKVFKSICALTLVASLSACGQSATNQPAASASADNEPSLTPISICLEWTPNTNHTGIYVAQEKGYFTEVGLDVTIIQPPEDGATAMCAAGQSEFAISGGQDSLSNALALDEPLPVTAVAAILQHNTSGIISRAGEGIDRPKGLEGHTYSTWQTPSEQAMIENVMVADGGDYALLNQIPNNITDEAAALAAHQTDAIWVYYGWGVINAQFTGVDTDFFFFKDFNPELDYYTPLLIANNDYLAQHPDESKAMLSALAKGYQYAAEHPEEAAQILVDGDTTGALAGQLEFVTQSQQWLSTQYLTDDGKWGVIDSDRWNSFYAWLWENELLAVELPEGTGFTTEYMP